MRYVQLTDGYKIAPVIKGGWQLAGDHGAVDREQAIKAMFAYYDAGLRTLDCADIYSGVEEMIGEFRRRLIHERGAEAAKKLQVHTKFVPDRAKLDSLSEADIIASIDASREKLGVEQIDLVQFHWWDFAASGYVEAALVLSKLQKAGKIRHIGVTNFDVAHLGELINAGVKVASNQVQYSVFDRRVEKDMTDYAAAHSIGLLAYGTLAGGLLARAFAGHDQLSKAELASNRSYVKYQLMIDENGGWEQFQRVLSVLQKIGDRLGVSPSVVASAYVLHKPAVTAVIIGARTDAYLDDAVLTAECSLSADDILALDEVTLPATNLQGSVYGLERTTKRHGDIMKYNLNKGDGRMG